MADNVQLIQTGAASARAFRGVLAKSRDQQRSSAERERGFRA
jgi:hypothetical protein